MLTGSPDKPGLLQGVSPCRIVIDGLDECEASEQRFVVDDLVQLVSTNSQANCKLLICSRDVPEIGRTLQKKAKRLASISLSKESEFVSNTIQAFAKSRIQELIDEKPSLRVDNSTINEITQVIVEKSDGLLLLSYRIIRPLLNAG